jgi:hypothetical protein
MSGGGFGEFLKASPLETEVSFDAKEVPLVALAKDVEDAFPGRTAIPSALVDSQVTMQVEGIRLDDLFQEVGLIVLEEPQTSAE